jgi:hypothetical protein
MPDISRLVIEVNSSGVVTANGNLDEFNKMAEKAGKSSDEVGKKGGKAATDLAKNFAAFQLVVNKLPGPLRSVTAGLLGMVSPAAAAVSAFLELGGAIIQFGKDSLQAFGEFELIRSNLELTMGSAKEAKRVFSEVKDFAMKTPFDVAGTAQAVNMLKQAGIATKDLISTVEMLGNVSGGSMERFNRISYNYVQVLQKGVLDARDTREFAGNLVPINKALEAIGATGKATADDMVRAFQYMTREGGMFYNAMFKQADTLVGKTSQMKEAWQSLLATIADKTDFGSAVKYIIDAFQFLFSNFDNYLSKQNELNRSMEAWDNGIYTEEQALLALNEKIKNTADQYAHFYDMMNNPNGTAAGNRMYDVMLFELSEELAALRKQYDYYSNIIEKEKERTAELERQNKLIEAQKKFYTNIMEDVNSRYASMPQGRIEALRKTIADNERLLAQGPRRQVPSLFTPLDYGPQRPGEDMRTVGAAEEDRRKIETVNAELKKELDKLIKDLNITVLKDWQIELGKIFNFTPTAETKGLPTVTKYIEDLNEESERLSASYGGKTIADILGISELDQINDRITGIQSKLRSMLEFNGSEPWTVNDPSVRRLLAGLDQAAADLGNIRYNDYLADLEHEYDLLGKSNEEREKALFLDGMKEAGISGTQADELWEAQIRNNARRKENEDEKRYKTSFENTKEELTFREKLLELSKEDARIAELTKDYGGRKRAEEIYALEREVELREILKSLDRPYNEIGNFTAGMFDTSKLDLAKAELADIEDRLRSIAELKISGRWTEELDAELEKLEKDRGAASETVGILTGNEQYEKYLNALERERGLLGMSNREREKAVYLNSLAGKGMSKTQIKKLSKEWELNQDIDSWDDYENSIKNLKDEIKYAGMGTYEGERRRLIKQYAEFMPRRDIEDSAARTVELQKQLEILESQDAVLTRLSQMKEESISSGNLGQYAAASAGEKGYNLLGGTDIGTFAKTTAETGSWQMGLIETFLQALANAAGGIDGLQNVLSPITEALKELSPAVKSILLPFLLLEKGLAAAVKGIMSAADYLTGGMFSALSDAYDSLVEINDERDKEEERLRALNEQYAKLTEALKEQEEYYLQQRRHLNAEHAIENYTANGAVNVNDAIITPKGAVYTNPNDFIIATKHPESLAGGGAAQVGITIINNTPASVTAQEGVDGNGVRQIAFIIDQVVQNGLAAGKYDGALDSMNRRRAGVRVTR